MKIIKVILLTLVLYGTSIYASGIDFLTHNTKGYTYIDKNGELRGIKNSGKRAFCIELVREIMDETNHNKNIMDLPFKRAFKFVTTKNDFALFNISRTKEREDMVKWVGPILEDSSYFYKLKTTPVNIKSLEDAKKVDSICVMRGGMHYKALIKKGFTNLVQNNSYVGCFEMLKTNKVTLTVSADSSLLGKLKEAGIKPDDIKGFKPLVTKSGGYIAFSKNVSDTLIDNWQNTLDRLKRDGKYKKLYEEYFIKIDK